MTLERSLLGLLFDELGKLSASEVKNFCGEIFFEQTKHRFRQGHLPILWKVNPVSHHNNVQVISFESTDHQLVEVALLKAQWEIYSSADRLTYRFFQKEFTAALFARPQAFSQGRQLLSDVFTLLWLMTRPANEQKEWNLSEVQRASLQDTLTPMLNSPFSGNTVEEKTTSLLVCIPKEPAPPTLSMESLPATIQAPTIFQGQLFKVFNPTSLKAKAANQEANTLGFQIEKYGLVELQILMSSGRIIPLRDNEDLLPYLENFRSERADRRMLDKLCKIGEDDSLLLRSFERNKFNLIEKFFTEGRSIRLVFGYNHTQERFFTPCSNFEVCPFGGIYQKLAIELKLTSGHGQLEIKNPIPTLLTEALITNQVAYLPSSKSLIFHDLHQSARHLLSFLGEKYSPHNVVEALFKKSPPFTKKGHKYIYDFLKDLHREFHRDFTISSVVETKIEHEPILELLVTRESFRLSHRIKHGEKLIHFFNLAPEWTALLKGTHSGLIATESPSVVDFSYSIRRSQRQHEIKFLKHTGIFMTVLYSSLDWKLHQELLGKSKALFYEELWQKIELLLLPRNESNRTETLDSLISSKIKKIAINFVEGILDILDPDHESVLILDGELLFIRGLILQQAKVIFFWLHQIASLTKGDLFAKSLPKYFPFELITEDGAPESNEYFVLKNEIEESTTYGRSYPTRNQESQYQVPLSSWAKLQQTYPEIKVHLDGRPLEQLSAQQFQVNFELSAADANIPGSVERIDWFDLNPKYFLNGKEISEVQAKKLTYDGVLEYQGRFYVLDNSNFPSQKALEIFWKRLQFNQQKVTRSTFNKNEGESTQRHHVLELLALRRMGIVFQGPKEWEAICEYYDRLSQPRGQLDLGSKLNNTLKPYQLAGVQWLWDLFQLRIGGILADDMGLGKTAQALSFLEYGYNQGAIKKTLVIVPVSLTFNWIAEAEKFTPSLNVEVFEPKAPETLKANVIVCTYSLLSLHHKLFESTLFDVVIFDEAQYLKNIGTNRFKSSEHVKARFKIALTGTPIENNLAELYALFHLVAPGLLGSRQDFHRNYVKPEELPEENLEFLRAKLKPLILRRRKQDLSLELPDKTENQIYVEFSKKQKELYRNTALSWSQKVNEAVNQKGASQSKLYMLTALLRLRQICSDPAALPSVSYKEIPPKVTLLLDMLEEITAEGHSAIVFTQFMSTFGRLKELLKKKNIRTYEMHGGTPRKDRESLLKEFCSDESSSGSVLLMTLKTGGVGLNLTKASYVFHIEPWWNPAVENQATDRVHRLGQNKNVTVYRLIMKESVEEKVELLKKRKSQLFNSLFGDDYFSLESTDEQTSSERASSSTITKEDFDALIQ